MKAELKQILRDLRAAIVLRSPEAVNIALDGLSELPGVRSNDPMNPGFIEQVILPVGELLSRLPVSWLRPLFTHELAVGRALGAVAIVHHFVKNDDTIPEDLQRPGKDSRSDVRLSLGQSIISVSSYDPVKIFKLGADWISQPSPRIRQTALIFLPSIGHDFTAQIFDLLDSLSQEEDKGVNAALVRSLNELGEMGYACQVLNLLSTWNEAPEPNFWVICRSLSASWAAKYPAEVIAILRDLHVKTGDSSHITNAIKALRRHGVEVDLSD
jgi:hypothetical protein